MVKHEEINFHGRKIVVQKRDPTNRTIYYRGFNDFLDNSEKLIAQMKKELGNFASILGDFAYKV